MPTLVQVKGAEEAFTLKINQRDAVTNAATVPVRWRLSNEAVTALQAQKSRELLMLIVVENGGQEMARYIVPLRRAMKLVSFYRAGVNVVHATIVWSHKDSSDDAKTLLTREWDEGGYKLDVLAPDRSNVNDLERELGLLSDDFTRAIHDRNDDAATAIRARQDQVRTAIGEARNGRPTKWRIRDDFDSINRIDFEATYLVTVPENMFGKKRKLMKFIGRIYRWKGSPRDQCRLRARVIVTLATIWIVGPLWFIVGALAWLMHAAFTAILLFFGKRGLDFRPLRHPLKHVPAVIWDGVEASVWTHNKVTRVDVYDDGLGREHRSLHHGYEMVHPVLYVLNPPVILGTALVGWLFSRWLNSILYLVAGLTAILVVSFILTMGLYLMRDRWAKKAELAAQARKSAEQRRAEEIHRMLMSLATGSDEPSISALPRSQRTIRLYMENAKAAVCKPFQR